MEKTGNRWFKGFMVATTVILLAVTSLGWHNQFKINNELKSTTSQLEMQVEILSKNMLNFKASMDTLRDTHPYMNKKWRGKKTSCASGSFFGFLLYTPVDTAVSKELVMALSDYNGPKAKINSLKRHYNHKSKHYCGKAVDLAWDETVISFLISDEGQTRLHKHGIPFYVDGRPGSNRGSKYLGDQKSAQFVFFNPNATADHVHLNV